MGARATEAGVKVQNLPRVRTAVAVGNAPILELVHSPPHLPIDSQSAWAASSSG